MAPNQPLNQPLIGRRLALGTAQFGMGYGIANKQGQVATDEVKRILALASSHFIQTLDTAMDYGQSEACLGVSGVSNFNVVTKLSALPNDVDDVKTWVREKVEASLTRLNASVLQGLLLHRPSQLTGPHGDVLAKTLVDLKNAGLVEKIGVSIYSPKELPEILAACPIDLVQAPFNLVDRRIVSSGWLKKLYDFGIEVHTRSTFLQGLLLMPRAEVPGKFDRWSAIWHEWHSWLMANRISAVNACLGFVCAYPQISKIIVGVDSAQHLYQLLSSSEEYGPITWPNMSSEDEMLVNPANWNIL